MPYFIWIAWRYLVGRVRQTGLTVTGVVLAVTIVTMMQSFIGGFVNDFTKRALQTTPDVTVTQETHGLPNPAAPLERGLGRLVNPVIQVNRLPVPREEEELKNPRHAEELIAGMPGVLAVAPFLAGEGLAVNGDVRQPVSFLGVRPLQEALVTRFQEQLTSGSAEALAQRAGGIILGRVLASDLSAEPGDSITLLSAEGVSRRFSVVGIYSSELLDVDRVRAYINLPQAQQLLATRGISGIGVRTASLDDAVPVARQIEARTDYTARTWREVNANILGLFTTISLIIYLLVGATMVVAGFGIANTLMLTVNEKRRDIGVLKAMGVPPRHIAFIFITTGVLVGIVGVLIGEALGAVGIHILEHVRIPIEPSPEAQIAAQTFPMLRTPRVYVISAIFGLLVSVLFSLLPSTRAAKADPVAVIRGAE